MSGSGRRIKSWNEYHDEGAVAPTVEKVDSSVSDSVERHPAYGQIGASRVSGHGVLYGSDFEHQHFVTITIRRSELYRGLGSDREHGGDELISVALSEAQWAAFVSTLNSGMGTCCTIQHIDREGVPGILRTTNQKDKIMADANAKLAELVADLKALSEEIEGRARKTVMRDLASGIAAQFSSHSGLAFLARQFGEQVEETIEKAKIEVNAYVENRISRAGIAALKGEPPPISLPTEKKP